MAVFLMRHLTKGMSHKNVESIHVNFTVVSQLGADSESNFLIIEYQNHWWNLIFQKEI